MAVDGNIITSMGPGTAMDFGIALVEIICGKTAAEKLREDNIYEGIFRESCKQYYYNRCGMTLTSQYAGERSHNACHTGKAVFRENISEGCDVSGGWHQDEKGQKDVVTAECFTYRHGSN